ncbi:MAG TPA: hypothetical protein VGJ94_03540 [Syntrophorhabdaceae bacterium]|jgi:hypothetical protein
MKKRSRGLAAVRIPVILFVLAALTGCYSLRVDMTPYSAPSSCPVTVTDERADPRAIVGSEIDFTIAPPLTKVLKSKLCRSDTVAEYVTRNTTVIRISRAEISSFGFVGTTKMLTIEGSLWAGLRQYQIVARGTIESDVPERFWPALLNSALDDFVKRVEEKLP